MKTKCAKCNEEFEVEKVKSETLDDIAAAGGSINYATVVKCPHCNHKNLVTYKYKVKENVDET